MAAPNAFGELGLSVIGVGSQYPPYSLKTDSIDYLSNKFYAESPS